MAEVKNPRDATSHLGGRYNVIGRHREILHLTAGLFSNNNDIMFLVGSAGIGRSSIVEGLINSVAVTTDVEWEGWELLLSATLYDQWSSNDLKNLLAMSAAKTNTILHLKNDCYLDMPWQILSDIFEVKSDSAVNVIISLTPEQHKAFMDKHPALEGVQTLFVNELELEFLTPIVQMFAERAAARYGVVFTAEISAFCIELAGRYNKAAPQLAKVLELIDNTASLAQFSQKKLPVKTITKDHIANVAQGLFNLPEVPDFIPFSNKILQAEELLKQRVFGQDAAIQKVVKSLKRVVVGLKKPSRPIGVFMFVGWSGTGKTELAKAVCETLYGTEDALVRIDMSGFSEKETVWTLIGSARGYRDSDAGGALTEPMFKNPYRVVLFDEIEKAAPETLDLFLQIFDDGRLADGRGNVADFSKSVIIMTSNQGTRDLTLKEGKASLGFFDSTMMEQASESEEIVLDSIKRNMRPELINRINSIVFFDKLPDEVLAKICVKQFSRTQELLKLKNIYLEWEQESIVPLILQKSDRTKAGRGVEIAYAEIVEDFLTENILLDTITLGKWMLYQHEGTLAIRSNWQTGQP